MKMTLSEIVDHQRELASLGNLTLPAKLSFAIKYNHDKFHDEVHRIDDQRVELCRRYADRDENGEPVMVESVINGKTEKEYKLEGDNLTEFAREYADLLATEVDIDIRKVSASLVEKCEESERYSIPTVAQLAVLDFMLDE